MRLIEDHDRSGSSVMRHNLADITCKQMLSTVMIHSMHGLYMSNVL